MACRKCGCLRLTKVGRQPTMLICVDCGAPVDDRAHSQNRRQRLVAAATLCSFALAGGLIFTITELNRSGGELELVNMEEEGGSGEEQEGGGGEAWAGGLLDRPLSGGAGGATPAAAQAEAAGPAAAHPPGHGPAEP